jgi:hypothetical protein
MLQASDLLFACESLIAGRRCQRAAVSRSAIRITSSIEAALR